jgi:hypothetical protein
MSTGSPVQGRSVSEIEGSVAGVGRQQPTPRVVVVEVRWWPVEVKETLSPSLGPDPDVLSRMVFYLRQ